MSSELRVFVSNVLESQAGDFIRQIVRSGERIIWTILN